MLKKKVMFTFNLGQVKHLLDLPIKVPKQGVY